MQWSFGTIIKFSLQLSNLECSFILVCAAIGTVLGIFLLEKLWSAINQMVPINDMAEDAIDTMYRETGMPVMLKSKPKIQD